MNGATHTAAGALAGISLCLSIGLSFKFNNATVFTLATVFLSSTGSLVPDIDISGSSMGRKHPHISRLFTHRGMTHTLVFPLIIGVLCYFASISFGSEAATLLVNILFPFLFGWVVHILTDMCNRKGVPILWPWKRKRIHIATFKTGTWNEGAFLLLMGLAVFLQVLFKLGVFPEFDLRRWLYVLFNAW